MITNYVHIVGDTKLDVRGELFVGASQVKTRWWYALVEWITWPVWLDLFFSKHRLYLRKLTVSELAEIEPVWCLHGGTTWTFGL